MGKTSTQIVVMAHAVPLGMTLDEIRWAIPLIRVEVVKVRDPLLLLALMLATTTDYRRGVA